MKEHIRGIPFLGVGVPQEAQGFVVFYIFILLGCDAQTVSDFKHQFQQREHEVDHGILPRRIDALFTCHHCLCGLILA